MLADDFPGILSPSFGTVLDEIVERRIINELAEDGLSFSRVVKLADGLLAEFR